jgi:hypothetical protein
MPIVPEGTQAEKRNGICPICNLLKECILLPWNGNIICTDCYDKYEKEVEKKHGKHKHRI